MATGGASGSVPSKQTQRIQRDLQVIETNPLPFLRNLQLEHVDNLNKLKGVLIGPDGSDYAGGHFRFLIEYPPEYPFKPPEFAFVTAICHPNVDTTTGAACHDQLLATWTPRISLKEFFTEMHSLLAKPNYDTPIVGDKLTDKSSEKAREWTQFFAKASDE